MPAKSSFTEYEFHVRLERFDASWHTGTVPVIEEYLPPGDAVAEEGFGRLELLAELIMIDLEYRWRRGRDRPAASPESASTGEDLPDQILSNSPRLEDYLDRYPELGGPAETLLKLIAEEYRVRQRWGDKPDHDEYLRRFPNGGDALRAALEEIDQQLSPLTQPPGLHVRCPHCQSPIEFVEESPLADIACPSCGSSFSIACEETLPHTPAKGKTIGHFELIERLGLGGFGTVWKARDMDLDRTVAMKIPRKGQLELSEVEQFLREARTAAQLTHPNIVSVHEVGRDGETIYIVSDLVHGVSLADWLTGQRLSAREAAELGRKIAEALHHAHERGVVHRDLKPQNIMIDADGEPRLTDFGLARRVAGEITMTAEGQILGTPAYMSPEQAQGEAHQADPRSDVYSLGVILFELLTGALPFRGNARMVIRQVINDEPPSPRKLNAGVPRDLETVCLKCLEKEPRKRYSTAREVAEELGRFLRGEPTHARPVTALSRTWRWCKRNPVVSSLTAGLLVALAAGFIGVTSQWLRAESHAARETEARRQTYRLLYASDMDVALQAWEAANVGRARDLLVRHLPGPDQEDLRGFEWYYLWRLCQRSAATPTLEARASASVAFSPDGKTLASAGFDGTVELWDVVTRRKKAPLKAHHGAAFAVAFAPDGMTLASGSFDTTIILWDVHTGDRKKILEGHTGYVRSLAFSPDGTLLASGSDDRTVRLWDIKTGQPRTLGLHEAFVWSVAFSPDGNTVASGSIDNTVKLWNVAGGEPRVLKAHDGRYMSWAFAVAFSPDGKTLAASGPEQTVRLWDVTTGQLQDTLAGHKGDVSCVAFSPDGKTLASGCTDNTVKLWNTQTHEEESTLVGHSSNIYSLAFSPVDKILATTGTDRTVKLWDVSRVRDPDILKGHSGWVFHIAFSPDGRTLASASFDGTVRLWDVATGRPLWTFEGHAGPVSSVAFSPDGKSLASASLGGTVRLLDAALGEVRSTPIPVAGELWSVAFSPDGKTILAGAKDGTIWRADVAAGKPLAPFKGHMAAVSSLAFSRDGSILASSSWDGTVSLWDATTGERKHTLRGHTVNVSCVAFSPDGKTLASGGGDSTVILWDSDSGERLASLEGLATWVLSVEFFPKPKIGQRLACGCGDGTVRLWDVASQEERGTLRGHTRSALSVTFSPDGHTLASGSQDGTIRFWRAATEEDVQEVLAKGL